MAQQCHSELKPHSPCPTMGYPKTPGRSSKLQITTCSLKYFCPCSFHLGHRFE